MRGERRQEWSAGGRRLVTIAVAWVLALTIIASAIMIATGPANPTDKSHPLNADDVVFSYNMIKDNSSSSVLGSYVSFLDTITRVDDYTVRMTTGAPFAAMNATITVIPIFPKYLWQSISDPVANDP